jgi:cobalt-zinc-cadmium efflux system outer membrane protein
VFRAFLAALLLAALLLAALPAALASAAAPGGPPAAAAAERSALGWDDVVRLAAAAPSLAAGRLEVAAAARRVDEALAVPNPTLGAGVGQGIARYGDETRVEWGLSLAVPLDWLYRRAAAADAARAGVGAAAAELAGARLELLDRLRVVFWRMAGAQAAALDLAALEEDAAAFAAAVQARVDHGEGRPPEGTRAALEVEAVRAARVRAEARRAAAQAELAAWLGLPDPGAVAAAAGFEEPPALPDRERLLARVAARHPGVRRAAADVAVAAAAVEEERSRRLPGLEVTPFFESELDRDAWGVEVGVELPLWNWNGAGIARAEAEQAAAAERAAAVGRAVQAELAAAWGRCALRREAAVRHAGEVLPRTAALVTAEEESWRLGEAGLLEVLDARRTLAEARRAWRAALLDAWLDCSALALLERELDEDAPARDTAGFDGGLR